MSGELIEFERKWAQALVDNDREALERLLAPEFRLSFAEDPRAPRVVLRDEWFVTLGRMTLREFSFPKIEELEFGNRGVVHMHTRFIDWTFDGTVLPSDFVVTDVFVRRNGQWTVINRISDVIGTVAPSF